MEKKTLRRNESGFTLLELMFAAGVLAVGLGLLFGSLVSLTLLGQVAEGKVEATAYLASVQEELRATPSSELFSFTVPPPPEVPGYTMAAVAEVFHNTEGAKALPLNNASVNGFQNPLRVRITVVYTTPRGHMFSISSTTFRTL